MELRKGTIAGSPFVGIFGKATKKFVLIPHTTQKKELAGLNEFFGAEIIHASLANCALLGILSAANSHGIVVPRIIEDSEITKLEQLGLRVKKLKEVNAIGNLVSLNDSKGICSKVISKETKREIESFLKVELNQMEIATSELVGAALVVTNKGFVAHAKAAKEIPALEKFFGIKGKATTANYGDAFVSHSILANENAALIGIHTTQHEMLRIDDGLRGE